MVSIVSLWLPILVSSILVFFASFLLHMLIPFHKGDYRPLPSEDEAREKIRSLNIPPGDYMVPCAGGPEAMKDPAFIEKIRVGPVLTMTVMQPGKMGLGDSLAKWFVYLLADGILCAYITGRALGADATFGEVVRFSGTTAFIAYCVALWQMTIWYKRQLATTIRYTVDGLIFGVLTGLAFGWLWPR